ncbi:hypothetical protein [Streptomyces sp. NRRL S-118]|uniref:hypothetical protein n=1 Tax=Streptomyces sp. NRRL S-118 TaxID=1463881 RepID=UPI0004C604FC|nr:hypothetical protein [Streptomyces sp. NRRL S-118]
MTRTKRLLAGAFIAAAVAAGTATPAMAAAPDDDWIVAPQGDNHTPVSPDDDWIVTPQGDDGWG